MVLADDGDTLYLTVGGNTNNGAPSSFFSYTAEYALSGTILEIDLAAIEAMDVKIDENGGQGGNARSYVYDLPTLDDPNIANDGIREDANGNDVDGPWGGNDGLNMAILPADAPLRIFADGMRNAYDLAMDDQGRLFTVDNGSNDGLGDDPNTESNDEDGDGITGEAVNTPNNGGDGDPEPLYLIEEGGYYGHPAPIRSNQNQSWTVYDDDGDPDTSPGFINTVDDISERVPDGVLIADGFIIDPSKYAALDGLDPTVAQDLEQINALLKERGERVEASSDESANIVAVGSSTNGIIVYDSEGEAFDGILDGKIFVTQFNDNITLLNINDAADGLDGVPEEGPDGIFGTPDDVVPGANQDGILEVANNSLGVPLSNPLDVTQGPNGTLWVAEIGGNEITVLAPSDSEIIIDNDADDDGIINALDPFQRDAANGTGVTITPDETFLWDFDPDQEGNLPGPDGFGGGLTGVMIDGETDYEAFFQEPSDLQDQIIKLDNVKFITAAGGGTTVIEQVSNGDPFKAVNTGEYLFHTGVKMAENVGVATIKWSMFNPGDAITGNFQQLGGYIGNGTQSDYMKIVAIDTGGDGPGIQVSLENNDGIVQTDTVLVGNLFEASDLPEAAKIFVELQIDVQTGIATPKASYETNSGLVEITGFDTFDLADTDVLSAIRGETTVQGQETGLAVGLFSSNTGEPTADAFQAVFDDIEITATEAELPPDAQDDQVSTGVNAVLTIPVADLLANDSDPNPSDALSITGVSNPTNGTAVLDDNGTVGDTSDDFITFTPDQDFEGQAGFSYTVSDGTSEVDADVDVLVSDAQVIYRVNAGGPEVAALESDPNQIAWAANTGTGAQSGPGFSVNTGNISSHSIANQNEPGARDESLPDYAPYLLFDLERWDPPAGSEMLWNFDVTAGQTYQVNLFVRNGFDGTSEPDERVFDIAIEGFEYFSDIDLSEQFGHQVGGMLSQTLVVEDSSLDIEFLHDIENPLVNAIEIIQLTGAVSDPKPVVDILNTAQVLPEDAGELSISITTDIIVPNDEIVDIEFTITPTGGATAGPDGDYAYDSSSAIFENGVYTDTKSIQGGSADLTIPLTILDDTLGELNEGFIVTITGVSENANLGSSSVATVTIQDDDAAPGDVLVRINSGGAEVASTDEGPNWLADQNPNPTPFLVAGGESTFSSNTAILVDPADVNDAPAAIFGTERFDQPSGAEMAYEFNLENGLYTVNLYLAEGSETQSVPDGRSFDVAVEGVVPATFDNIDLFALGGSGNGGTGNNAFLLSVTAEVTDGTLNLDFLIGEFNNPAVRGIEIVAGGEPSYDPPLDTLFGEEVEISDERLLPTNGGILTIGDNVVVATQEGEIDGENGVRDRDYFTFTIPQGGLLTGIFLDGYDNQNPVGPDGFLAIQLGDQITVDPVTGAPDNDAGLLGAIIYGTGEADGTTNLLDIMSQGGIFDPGSGASLPAFDLPLTGEVTVWLNQGAGPGTPTLRFVVEEDPSGPSDIDSDGTPDTADPFAFDGQNGLDNVLEPGGEVTQDFNTPTEDPFDADGGFSGILVNPNFAEPGASPTDPYGDRTLEDDVSISGGVLSIKSSPEDSFGDGTDVNNTIRDNYQSAVDVSGVEVFEVSTSVSSPDFASKQSSTNGFEQFGVQVGTGTVDQYIKLVVSDDGGNAPRVQLAGENTLLAGTGGSGPNYPLSLDLTLVVDYEISLTVDTSVTTANVTDAPTAGQVVGVVNFLDADGAIIETVTTDPVFIDPDSDFADAIAGNNPATGGSGGIGYGVVITDFNAGNSNEITANFDFLTIKSLDTTEVSISAPVAPVVEDGDSGDTLLEFGLSATNSFSGSLDLVISLDGGTTETPVTGVVFVDGTASLSIPVANDDVANGPDVVTVTLVDAPAAFATIDPVVNSASGTVTEDDGPALTVSIDADTISEPDGTATVTITRNDGGAGILEVQLTSSDPTSATVPPTATFPDEITSIDVTLTVVDDEIVEALETITVTATATGYADGSDTVDIEDDDVEVGDPLALDGDLDGDTTLNSADDDIDGDGIANLDDREAYRAESLAPPVVEEGTPIVFDFSGLADGATPFEAGFTGVAQTADGSPELDYTTNGAFGPSGLTNPATVQNGKLVVETTNDDTSSADSGFIFLAETGGQSFELSGTFDNPAFGGDPLVQFSQFGLILSLTGAPGTTGADFVKLTTGNPGAGLELSGAGSAGSVPKPAYPDGVTGTNYAEVDLTMKANIVNGAVQIQSTAVYKDDQGNILGELSTAPLSIPPGTPMANALLDLPGAPDPAFGITSTDFGGGGAYNVVLSDLSLSLTEADVLPPEGDDFGLELISELDASDGVATGGSYAPSAVGSAVLDVMSTVDNVQSSNFGSGSFKVTNTGDKGIAAVFIDFRDAVFGDSVVDFDGTGGDTTAKPFVVDNQGDPDTGAFFDGAGSYFLPGDAPLPNTTGSGNPATGGFRGLLLKAGTADGGFESGEVVSFAGDMDPNSIAGLLKGLVDTDSVPDWDVGGVSGAEVAGSRFFVLFDDGSTAEGVLGNSGTQAGSIGRAIEGQAPVPVSLTVNDGSGTYGGTEPVIQISGVPGQVVQVVLSKGFQPVQNTDAGVSQLVDDRLALSNPEFPVNNAFDIQTIEVTIGNNGTVTVPSGVFDYVDTESGVSFDGDDVSPIAISAVAIDGDGFAIGEVEREYLTNPTETPVSDAPPTDPDVIELTPQQVVYEGTSSADVYVIDALTDSTTSALDRIREFTPTEGDKIDFSALGLTIDDLTFVERGTGEAWVFTRIDGPSGFRLRVDEPLSVVQQGLIFGSADPVPPVAEDDSGSTVTQTPLILDVLANDSDANGDDLSIADFDQTTSNGGTIVLDDNGTSDTSDDTLVYTAGAGFEGVDTFSYTVADEGGLEDTATVTVTVDGIVRTRCHQVPPTIRPRPKRTSL
ncbi:MAG: Ig-like domain-containing protein [Pseudomonadota bacterium]